MVFADHGYRTRVIGSVPTPAFAVIVRGVRIQARSRVARIAFRSFFFDFCCLFGTFFPLGLAFLVPSLSSLTTYGDCTRVAARSLASGAPQLASVLALLTQLSGIPCLSFLNLLAAVTAVVGSTASTEGHCDNRRQKGNDNP